ncbi:MAG: hypothetical protein HY370_05710 [Proteobacteria bacterium]|nr:hypothetical protein [Pseudomonadota bacterium]
MVRGIVRRIAVYLFVFTLVLPAASMMAHFMYQKARSRVPPGASTLDMKIPWYLAHKDEYDVIFLGDSRTLTDIHPDLLAPYIGPRAVNLAHWATWMPMQYAIFRDLVGKIPPGTVVVWSVGHQNFQKQTLNAVYPVGFDGMLALFRFGYGPNDILKSQAFFMPPLMLLMQADKLYRRIEQIMSLPLLRINGRGDEVRNPASFSDDLLKQYREMPGVGYAKAWYGDDGSIASIEQYKTNGAYLRTEMDPSFYRRKQKENEAMNDGSVEIPAADPESWGPFVGILEMCRKNGIRLIVNEVEDAPYRYATLRQKEIYRAFMRDTVQKTVGSYGFSYVRVDFDRLLSEDYFDHNHMNSKGVGKFTPLFGDALRRAIRERYPDAL